MDWFRTKIGLQEPTPSQPPPSEQPPPIDPAKLLRAQRQKLKQKEEELTQVSQEFEDALESGDVPLQRSKLQRKRDLDAEIRQLRGKIANQATVADTLSTAEADLQQAHVLKSGAEQLGKTVHATKELEIEQVVSDYQVNAKNVHEFGSLLSEPLFSSSAQEDGEDIEEELARMQEEAVIRRMTEPKKGVSEKSDLIKATPKKIGTKE